MSQENVEVVRRAIAYEYDGVGDLADAEAIFDPHVDEYIDRAEALEAVGLRE